MTFVLRQEEGTETISKAALLQFLQHEYEVGPVCCCCCGVVDRDTTHSRSVVADLLHVLCLQNVDSSDATAPQPQMQFMPFQQAGEFRERA